MLKLFKVFSILLSIYSVDFSSAAAKEKNEKGEEPVLVRAEFQNNHVRPIRVYSIDRKTGDQKLEQELGTKHTGVHQSHPGDTFVTYDINGIRRDMYIVTANYGENQTFLIRNYELVEAVFHNVMGTGAMDVFWVNQETQEEIFNGKVDENDRINVGTHPGHKFGVYNSKDKSARMEFTVTANAGESQLFVLQNRVQLSFQNSSQKGILQVFWKEKTEEEDSYNHHRVGTVEAGQEMNILSDPFHSFVAYDSDEEGKPKDYVGEFIVTAGIGETQTFKIGERDEL